MNKKAELPSPDTLKDYLKTKKQAEETTSPPDPVWSGVWVVIEYSRGEVAPVSWELLGEGDKLARELGCNLSGILLGYQVEAIIPEVFGFGAEQVFVIDAPELADYRTAPYAEALVQLAHKYRPEILLMGATAMGRDVFPAVATKLQTGLTADCTILSIDPASKLLLQTRPAFGGNILATILCKTHRPQMATVRPRVMSMPDRSQGKTGTIIREAFVGDEDLDRTEILDFIQGDAKHIFLDKAEILVAVGLGIGSKKNMTLAEELADVLGATIAGTRGAVESGWISHERQVGQTGVTVRPKLYFALGISGAIQHVVGMERSDYIIAVNNDPEAPILNLATYGIVGDLTEVVPALTAEFKKRLQHGLAK